MKINETIILKMKQANEQLINRYGYVEKSKNDIREKLIKSNAYLRKMEKMSAEQLQKILGGRKLGGVDGSVNQTKGNPPHVIHVFRALAKTTTGDTYERSDVFVPLLEERDEQQYKRRSYLLSKLELESAYELIDKEDVRLLLMDGALYHYRIDAPEEWERLAERAVQRGTWIVGVSEEITTENLVRLPAFSNQKEDPYAYDRDLLFGVLEPNEMLFINEIQSKAGLQSVWMRLGSTPSITGFDMIVSQSMHKETVGDILRTLTPKEGRGIPLWLDHVDAEVRVTDKIIEGLVEQYVHPLIKKKFFTKMRKERPY